MARPAVTSLAEIEAAAFRLFARDGFEATTVQAIADECGIGRRTLLRYFPSKNDIPWGPFGENLAHLRAKLAGMPLELPLSEAVEQAVLHFNQLDPRAIPQHRLRMALILGTPALQAHSALRYADWRAVIAEFVAVRTGLRPTDLLPRMVGRVSLALAVSAYELWLEDETASLKALLSDAMAQLRTYLRRTGEPGAEPGMRTP